MLDAGWAQALGTLLLGLVGLWFANSYRRQIRIQLVERQLDAHTRLWCLTESATPNHRNPLSEAERSDLYAAMMKWYFTDGDGILLSARARDLFVAVRTNLVVDIEKIKPRAVAQQLATLGVDDAERRRGCLSLRQMSLLRTQLKGDLMVHEGYRYYSTLRSDERALLRESGISLWQKPWRPRSPWLSPKRRLNPCVCGLCHA